MNFQLGKQTIAIHILSNISRSKGNQTMKFGQLIEYNMENIFLGKSYIKVGREIITRASSKISKLSEHMISLKFYTVSFYCMPNLRAIEKYRN